MAHRIRDKTSSDAISSAKSWRSEVIATSLQRRECAIAFIVRDTLENAARLADSVTYPRLECLVEISDAISQRSSVGRLMIGEGDRRRIY